MSDDSLPNEIKSDVVQDILTEEGNPSNMSLEALILLINTERLKYLHDKTQKEFKELKARQDQVSKLHNIQKKINAATKDTGELDISSNPELQQLLKDAKALGVDVKEDKLTYTKEERERLIENFRMSVDDLNVMNDMQLQTVNRLTNERYESYQLARSILKPLHDTKTQIAKNIARS